MLLKEGIDIDNINRIISFNPKHQNNVDTNDYIHPHIILNDIEGSTIISIFERKDNDIRNDGNPLVYALKGINGWTFKDPKKDIYSLFRIFVSVTQRLNNYFDTLIITPSHNSLNNTVFNYLKRIINVSYSFTDFFLKLPADIVENNYINFNDLEKMCKGDTYKFNAIKRDFNRAFDAMYKYNDNIFSYKFFRDSVYRKLIIKTLELNKDSEDIFKYADVINDKDIVVFDDTVTTGKTLSESAEVIYQSFNPKTITFLTLFSPRTTKQFKSIKFKI